MTNRHPSATVTESSVARKMRVTESRIRSRVALASVGTTELASGLGTLAGFYGGG